VATAAVPTTSDAAGRCVRQLARVLRGDPAEPPEADRPAAQIVSSWFRAHPSELQTIQSPAETLQLCRSLAAGTR
jgi:hypothetical protein